MNDLNDVIENFYQDVQRLHAEYESLIATVEAITTRELKEKSASQSKEVPVETDVIGTVRESEESTESLLETYLDEVIKKAGDLRIKNCKLDLEEESIPEDHELSSLVSETRSSVKNEELSSKRGSSRKILKKDLSREKSTPSPISVRERAKAYKPPPLPKKKGFQTTYGTSFRPNTPRTGKITSRTSENPSTRSFASCSKLPEIPKTRKTSQNDAERSCNFTSRSEIIAGSRDIDSLSSETSTLVNAELLSAASLSPSKISSFVFETTVKPEISKREISTTEQPNGIDIWPPVWSKKQKQFKFLEENTAPDKILKLHQKLVYSSHQYSSSLSAEIAKSEAELLKHTNSISAGREIYQGLVEIEKQLNRVEKEMLDTYAKQQQPISDFSKNQWNTILQDVELNLTKNFSALGDSMTAPPKAFHEGSVSKNMFILETIFGDSEAQNWPEMCLKRVSKQDIQKVELRFRVSLIHFELKLQQLVSEILDDISLDEHSVEGAAKNMDLVKFLYSIVINSGNKLPNFVYNDS